jgi:serine/threonine protein kinase, bacterial
MISSKPISDCLNHRYRLIGSLGQGGMGKAYLAIDTQRPGEPKCVVKHLQPADNTPEFLSTARRLFADEARILEDLGRKIPQVPQLLAYFEENNEFYLVQDFIEGHALTDELGPTKCWTEPQLSTWLQEMLSILAFVHQSDIIHRDIKPDNIIRDQEGKIHLIDFGAVKQIRQQTITLSQISHLTVSVGTHGYMPPEQIKGKPRLSSDIYAIGIIAIQALTGQSPDEFQEDDNAEILWRNQVQVSDRLANFITQMIAYHPRDRFTDANHALEQLKILSDQNIKQQPKSKMTDPTVVAAPSNPASSEASSAPLNLPTHSYRPWLIAAGVTITAIGALFGFNIWNQNQQDTRLLSSIEQLHQQKQFDDCINQANAAITQRTSLQSNLTKLSESCRDTQARSQLEQAKQIAQQDKKLALSILDKIDPKANNQGDVQKYFAQLSEAVISEASKRLETGNKEDDFSEAIDMLQGIPQNSPSYQQAQDYIKRATRNEAGLKECSNRAGAALEKYDLSEAEKAIQCLANANDEAWRKVGQKHQETVNKIKTPLDQKGTLDEKSPKLSDNTPYKEHTFKGGEGQVVTITMASKGFDARIFLRDSQDEALADSDDGFANGRDATIREFRLPKTGRYTIWSNSFHRNGTGEYHLKVETTSIPKP